MLDLDRHGKLGRTELLHALSLCGEEDTTDAEVAEMIRITGAGGTGDDAVDFQDFKKLFIDPPALFRNFDLQRRDIHQVSAEAPVAAASLPALPAPRPHSADVSEAGSMNATRTPRPPSPGQRTPDPRPEAISTIMGSKALKPQFIKQLYQRFVEIDTEENGLISYGAFCKVLRKAESGAMRRAFDVFDVDQTGELDLQQFVVSLSMFTKSKSDDKLKFAFMMYDEEQQGSLARPSLAEMLKAMAPHLPGRTRDSHVSRIYATQCLHPNARVTLHDLQAYMMEHEDELMPMTGEEASGAETSGAEA